MAVTLQQIAEKAGVSRGTVDRALNNRGRIRPEVAENVRKIAKEMGYHANIAGRAMSIKKNLNIGVIVQSAETPFIQEVVLGIKQAKKEVENLGGTLTIYQVEGMDAAQVIGIMEEMHEKGYNAIALMPSEDQLLRRTIDLFVDEYNIPVVTFNADLEGTKRMCFVGQDGVKGGQAAAGLMGEIVNESGKVCVISGNEHNQVLLGRVKGFMDEMQSRFPKIEVIGPRYTYDDNWVAERIMEEILTEQPDIKGVYLAGHGVQGVCQCLDKKNAEYRVKVVANDILKENISYLKKGDINFLIGQNPQAQGLEPTMILYRLLLEGKTPEKELLYTDIEIKTRYNV